MCHFLHKACNEVTEATIIASNMPVVTDVGGDENTFYFIFLNEDLITYEGIRMNRLSAKFSKKREINESQCETEDEADDE